MLIGHSRLTEKQLEDMRYIVDNKSFLTSVDSYKLFNEITYLQGALHSWKHAASFRDSEIQRLEKELDKMERQVEYFAKRTSYYAVENEKLEDKNKLLEKLLEAYKDHAENATEEEQKEFIHVFKRILVEHHMSIKHQEGLL